MFETLTMKQARQFRNYTQAYMAEQLGISRSTYMIFEKDPRKMTVGLFLQFAGLVEIPAEKLKMQ